MSSQEELMKELLASSNGGVSSAANKDQQAFKLASSLMKLLNNESVPKALWWLDNKNFAVDPKHFQGQVLDPHFRGTKYASFLRTMHKMGFARISRSFALPKGVVAYSCDNFQKDNIDLLKEIRMNNSGKKAKAAKAAAKAAAAASAGSGSRTESPSGAVGAATRDKKPFAAASPPSLESAAAARNLELSALNPGLSGMSGAFGGSLGALGGANTTADYVAIRKFEHQQMQMQRLREITLQEERVQLTLLAQAQMQARAADFQRQMADHSAAAAVMKLRTSTGLQADSAAKSMANALADTTEEAEGSENEKLNP